LVSTQRKWDEAYKSADIASAKAAQILCENAFLLDDSGDALELACGRAGNAIFLAKKGFQVDALDISPVVLEAVDQFAKAYKLPINTKIRDIESNGLGDKKYDVIVVSYFLNRGLFPQIINALKLNGLLFYQTWSQLKCDDKGPSNPAFRLQAGELLNLCDPLRVVLYRENGQQGDTQKGLRNEAMLIAQKM
jgi:SAM-dependent methyltransferase